MSEQLSRISFGQGTGLNSDDDLTVMPKGDSRERRNVILSESENFSVLSNVPSPNPFFALTVADFSYGGIMYMNSSFYLGGQTETIKFKLYFAEFISGSNETFFISIPFVGASDGFALTLYEKLLGFWPGGQNNGRYYILSNSLAGQILEFEVDVNSLGVPTEILQVRLNGNVISTSDIGFAYGGDGFEIGTSVENGHYIWDIEGNNVNCSGTGSNADEADAWDDPANLITATKDGEVGLTRLPNPIGNFKLPNGRNKVIGFCEDLGEDVGYSFIWNNQGYHSIVGFNKIDDSYFFVLKGSDDGGDVGQALNFGEFDYIHANVLDSRYLYWTDGVNPPAKINIDEAKNYTDGSSSIYVEITESVLCVGYYPPSERPYARAGNDPNYVYDNITDKTFFFAYAYVWEDGTISSLSPYSEQIGVSNFFSPPGVDGKSIQLTPDQGAYNVISLRLLVDNPLITQVKLYIKNGFNRDWLFYDNIDVSAVGEIYYNFYNDIASQGVDQNNALVPYYSVPLTADTQELINDSTLVYGNYKSGYDSVDVDLDFTPIYYKIGNQDGTTSTPPFSGASALPPSTVFVAGTTRGFFIGQRELNPYGVFVVEYNNAQFVEYFSGGYGLSELDSSEYPVTYSSLQQTLFKVADAIRSRMAVVTGISWGRSYDAFNSGYEVYPIGGTSEQATATFVCNANKIPTLRPLGTYGIGIVYYDEKLRSTAVNVDVDNESIIMPIEEDVVVNHSLSVPTQDLFSSYGVRIAINSSPPSWAKYYSVLITKDLSTSYSQQFVAIPDTTGRVVTFNIKTPLEEIQGYYSGYKNIPVYDFVAGDKCRIVSSSNVGFPSQPLIGDVQSYDVSTGDLVVSFFETYNVTPNPDIIEIFRSSQITNNLYYEVGGLRTITGGTHDDSIIEILEGDFFKGIYTIEDGANFDNYPLVSNQPLDINAEPSNNLGRPNAEIDTAKQTVKNALIWGGSQIDNTNINNIANFRDENTKYLDNKYGDITRINQIGEVLQVCQKRSVVSFYLGAEQAIEANNQATMSFTDNVIGNGRRMAFNYGCSSRESYIQVKNGSFFYDASNRSIIQYSGNGLQRISRYKMESAFRDIGLNIDSLDDSLVTFGWDEKNQLLMFTFTDPVDDKNNVTLSYHPATNRFISYYDYSPDYFGSVGNTLFSFKHGFPYRHKEDESRNVFYGKRYDSIVELHPNEPIGEIKDFNSIAINSNSDWEAPESGDVSILPDSRNKRGMSSRLKLSRFENQEGVQRADFLKDLLTQSSTPLDSDLINGRGLKGRELTVRIKNNNFEETQLYFVDVATNVSR